MVWRCWQERLGLLLMPTQHMLDAWFGFDRSCKVLAERGQSTNPGFDLSERSAFCCRIPGFLVAAVKSPPFVRYRSMEPFHAAETPKAPIPPNPCHPC